MSDPRKQPSVVWLSVALVVALPVAYVLSLGPLVGIVSRIDDVPVWLATAWGYYAIPGQLVYLNSPEIVQDALEGYRSHNRMTAAAITGTAILMAWTAQFSKTRITSMPPILSRRDDRNQLRFRDHFEVGKIVACRKMVSDVQRDPDFGKRRRGNDFTPPDPP
jgi:hypothetical protein